MANLITEDIEETYRTEISAWKQYVDDTFVVIQEELVEEFHSHLNSVKKTIQFTKELENDETLSYLDVEVSRKEDGAITTEGQRKPIHT